MAADAPYKLSALAEADLGDIWSYTVDTWSWEQAEQYHGEIVAAIECLAAGQSMGRRIDVREGYFKYPVGSHFVFYRFDAECVDVVRILHRRMDVSRYL